MYGIWLGLQIEKYQTWDSSRSRSTGERGRGSRRGDRLGDGGDSSGVRRGFSVPSSSLSCSRVSLRGSSAVVSSSPGLSLILGGPGGGGGRRGAGGRGGGGGGPGAGAEPSTGRGGGRGEEVRDKGRGEQVRERGSGVHVRDGGVGVEGREMEGGGERLLRRPHCSLFSLLLMAGGTWGEYLLHFSFIFTRVSSFIYIGVPQAGRQKNNHRAAITQH